MWPDNCDINVSEESLWRVRPFEISIDETKASVLLLAFLQIWLKCSVELGVGGKNNTKRSLLDVLSSAGCNIYGVNGR